MSVIYNGKDVTEAVHNGTLDTAAIADKLRGRMAVQGGAKGPTAEAAERALKGVLDLHPDIDLRTREIRR